MKVVLVCRDSSSIAGSGFFGFQIRPSPNHRYTCSAESATNNTVQLQVGFASIPAVFPTCRSPKPMSSLESMT